MENAVEYSKRERFWLQALAIAGLVGVNGAFVYGLVVDPTALTASLSNPISAAFVAEALVLVGVLAYLLKRWRVTHLAWGWFVALSVLGSLAFALPVALLWRRRRS